eukprot:7101250-Alexandrium_andersonii.AAC.1
MCIRDRHCGRDRAGSPRRSGRFPMLTDQLWPVLRPALAAIRPARRGDPAVFRCYPASFGPFSGQLWPRSGRLTAAIRQLADVIRPLLADSPTSFGRDQAGSPRRSGSFPMSSGQFWAVLRPAVAAIGPDRRGDPAVFPCYPDSLGHSPVSCGRHQAGSPWRSGSLPMLSGHFWPVPRPFVAAIGPVRRGDPAAFRCYPTTFG